MATLFDANLLELMTALRAELEFADSRSGVVLQKAVQAARARADSPSEDTRSGEPSAAARVGRGRYFTFVRIDIRHDFFNRANGFNRADGICDELAIQPTAHTARQLALFGLIPRPRPDGIDLLWASGLREEAVARLGPLVELIAKVPKAERARVAESIGQQLFGQPLFFTVSLSNPLFANFTEMPARFRIGDPPLLFSNRRAKLRKGEDHHADLTLDWGARAARPKVRKAPEAMAGWAMEEEAREATARSDESLVAAEVAPGTIQSRVVATASRRFALLDLHLVRARGSTPAAGRWDGMPISLDPGSKTPDPESGGIFHCCTYTLRFEARKTHWRYIVAARSGELNAEGLEVVGPNGGGPRFELAKEPRVLPDGRQAACFTSTESIPILARPRDEHAFSLVRQPADRRARPRMLVDRLPVAGIQSISPQPSQVWSDIYVFV